MVYYHKKIILSQEDKILIQKILNSKTIINICQGCKTSSVTAREIIEDEMIEKEFLEVLK